MLMTKLLKNSICIITCLCSLPFQANSQSLKPLSIKDVNDFVFVSVNDSVNAIVYVENIHTGHGGLELKLSYHNLVADEIDTVIRIHAGPAISVQDVEVDNGSVYFSYLTIEEYKWHQCTLKKYEINTGKQLGEWISTKYLIADLVKIDNQLIGFGGSIKHSLPHSGNYVLTFNPNDLELERADKFWDGFYNAMAFSDSYDTHFCKIEDTLYVPFWNGKKHITIARFDLGANYLDSNSIVLVDEDFRAIDFVLTGKYSGLLHIRGRRDVKEHIIKSVDFHDPANIQVKTVFSFNGFLSLQLATPDYFIVNQEDVGIRKVDLNTLKSEVLYPRENYHAWTKIFSTPSGKIYYYTLEDWAKERGFGRAVGLSYLRLQ